MTSSQGQIWTDRGQDRESERGGKKPPTHEQKAEFRKKKGKKGTNSFGMLRLNKTSANLFQHN